jgi:thiamine biosynthesis lipoprotein
MPGTAALADEAALDAGAMGKGIALDAAVAVLRAQGIEQAFLDFGTSSQIALGAPGDSPQGWRVAIAGLGVGSLRGFVTLRDAALSTSRTREPNAPEGAIIDPHSGRPVANARLATVRSSTAAAADAWSTAIVVLGRAGVGQAARADVDVYFEDGAGTLESPEFIEVSE